jgi:hypothetical protein
MPTVRRVIRKTGRQNAQEIVAGRAGLQKENRLIKIKTARTKRARARGRDSLLVKALSGSESVRQAARCTSVWSTSS